MMAPSVDRIVECLPLSNLAFFLPANSVIHETFDSAKARSAVDHDPSASASDTSITAFHLGSPARNLPSIGV